jgi:hypothetical protein
VIHHVPQYFLPLEKRESAIQVLCKKPILKLNACRERVVNEKSEISRSFAVHYAGILLLRHDGIIQRDCLDGKGKWERFEK